jgi:hypothetical protein
MWWLALALALPSAALDLRRPEPARVVLHERLARLPKGEKARAQSIAERLIVFYEAPLAGEVVVPLRYFERTSDFDAYVAAHYPGRRPIGGFFAEGEIVVGPGRRHFAVLVHELSHFLVGRALPKTPRWLDEGLSEFFEEASLQGAGLLVTPTPDRQRDLRRWNEAGRTPGLRTLLGLTAQEFVDHDAEDYELVRTLSWSVVDFLASSDDGRLLLRRLLAQLQRQEGLEPAAAVNVACEGGLYAFEEQWARHVERRLRGE